MHDDLQEFWSLSGTAQRPRKYNRGRQPLFVAYLSLIYCVMCRAVCRAFLTGLAAISQATNGHEK
jgi:hypothetical protein